MTEDTNNILDDLTRQLNQSKEEYQNAEREYNRKQEEIASQPSHSYEDFLKENMPEKPTTVVDPKKEKARMWVTNIGDAINAIGGIVGAGMGADVVPMASLSAANQARHDKLIAQRNAEREAYNKGVMNAQSHAISMANYADKLQAQQNAKTLAPYENRLREAKTKMDMAGDAYTQAYKQHRDAVGDEKSERAEERADKRMQQQISNSNRQQETANRREIRLHNDAEKKRYESVPIGEYYPLKGQTDNLYVDIYDTIKEDPAVKAAIGADVWNMIKSYEDNKITAMAETGKVGAIERLLKSDPNSDVYKKVMDAIGNSRYAGQPDIWSDDYFDRPSGGQEGGTPVAGQQTPQGSTPARTQMTTSSVQSAPSAQPTWADGALGISGAQPYANSYYAPASAYPKPKKKAEKSQPENKNDEDVVII